MHTLNYGLFPQPHRKFTKAKLMQVYSIKCSSYGNEMTQMKLQNFAPYFQNIM